MKIIASRDYMVGMIIYILQKGSLMYSVARSFLSGLLSLVLVVSLAPSFAFAQPSQEEKDEPGSVEVAKTENESEGQESVESSENKIHESSPDNENDSSNDIEASEITEESSDNNFSSTVEEESDPEEENSWRYSNGEVINSSQGASTYIDSLEYAISPFAMVTNPDGYKVFNWFDRFSNGYCTGANAYKGIDVSKHNGVIDWEKVKNSGVDFAIIRCGYGMDDPGQDDERWLDNVQGCLSNDIPFGVYLYSYATNTTRASREADHALKLLDEAGLDPSSLGYPVFFDMEDASTIGTDHAAIATTFCNKIEAAGYKAGVYSSTSWFNNRLTDPCFNNWTKWVAEWNASSGLTYDGVSNFSEGNGLWQFSDYGSVPGISGACDLNYTYMDPLNIPSVEDEYKEPSEPYETPIPNGDYLINTLLSTKKVVDIQSGSKDDGANAQLYKSNLSDAQTFILEADPNTGFYSIVCKGTGKALGLKKYSSGKYSTNVAQYTKDSSDNSQKWILSENNNGTLTVTSAINPGYVLDVASASSANGANVQVYQNNGSNAQQWYMLPVKPDLVSEKTVEDGLYWICASGDNSKVLDVTSASTENSANVQLYANNNTAAQKYLIQRGSDGFYTITNLNSEKVLDVASAGLLLKTNIHQYEANGSDAQKWVIQKNENGTYTFVSKVNGQALDLASGSIKNGTNVQTYISNGSAAQQFILQNAKGEKVLDNGTYVINSSLKETLVVDIAGAGMDNSANARLYSSNGTNAQKFDFVYDSATGFYTITNKNSGKVLDIAAGNYKNKTNVAQYASNDTLAQKWLISKNSDGSVTIAASANPKYVLDVASGSAKSGANVQIYEGNETAAQCWRIQDSDYNPPRPTPIIPEGTYYLRSALQNNKVVDIESGSTKNSANAQLYTRNNTKAQQFYISFDSETEQYTIKNISSGKVLDVASAKAANGTNVAQYSSNNTDAQKWYIVKNSDGSFTIKSALSGNYVLDVNAASTKNGANIQIYSSNGTNAQKWYFDAA